MNNYLFAILVILLTISCDADKVINTPEDDHILDLAYSDNYSYPDGCYHEIFDIGSAYYVNTLSITPLSTRDIKPITSNQC